MILDFIGGEPFLEIDLIDQICDYFKIKAFELNDEWYWNYRINVCTNGVNYNAEKIQNFKCSSGCGTACRDGCSVGCSYGYRGATTSIEQGK